MKSKLFLLLVISVMTAGSTFAQSFQRMSVPDRIKATMEKVTSALQLNDSQAKQTDSVFTDYYTAQSKMREDAMASGNRPDRSVFQKLSDDRDAKLKTIFTDQQYTKFKNEVEATLRPQRQGSPS
jgi:periplasmic protein CpxP/Spy